MQDLDILRFFLNRKRFKGVYKALPEEMFSGDTLRMLKWFGHYYKKYPDDDNISIDKLTSLMKLDPSVNKDAMDLTRTILQQLRTPIDPVVSENIMAQLEERKLAGLLGMVLAKWESGEEVDLTTEVLENAQKAIEHRKLKTEGAWEDGDVWQMVQEDADASGYLFDFLPEDVYTQLKGVNEGDNICVAAPTNKGKTSFLVNIAITFAKQRSKLLEAYTKMVNATDWVEPENFRRMGFRPVLYLVNEGTARKITPRIYQTALGLDREKLHDYGSKGILESEYIKCMGRRDAIRVVNIHGLPLHEVIRIIERHDPFLVVTDMTGRIRLHNGAGANDVQQLEEAWESMRVQAAVHNFIHVGTVQISVEGFNNYYPPLSAVQNSKTGIQTTWDLGIYIGALDVPAEGQEGIRGISTPKSKLARSGCKDVIKTLTNFNPELNTWA